MLGEVHQDVDADQVRGVILTSGKVYYELVERREKEGFDHVAIARVEQLYPFPGDQITELLDGYPNVHHVRWVQEEPENMGAVRFVERKLPPVLPEGIEFSSVSRDESGSPAGGSATVHDQEQETILRLAFEGL